jgi:deferrochelatase/peroxidase EfeB
LTVASIIAQAEMVKETNCDASEPDMLPGILKDRIYNAAKSTEALQAYRYQSGRGELAMEKEGPFVQVSFDYEFGHRYASEIVLTVRAGRLEAYVQTYRFLDNFRPAQNYRIYDEQSGDFDVTVNVESDDETLLELIERAIAEARSQIEMVANEEGFRLGDVLPKLT